MINEYYGSVLRAPNIKSIDILELWDEEVVMAA
jgi:hypothetical protein